ncbi:MAG TPA: ABC transporter ATP-binding protein [Casimicrobiaceae bacterium]|nr:ABC transporter ATP-binding protein [Casimicrobiaceae bacterium]
MALLEIDDLTAFYGTSQVLFGLSFGAEAGECVTLLGRNGMGKTTTVKSVVGMLHSRKGSVRFDGRDIANLASYRIAQTGIGLVPEMRQIFPTLSVRENLVATARVRRDGGSAPWTLERVYALFPRLAERSSNMGNQLSGGEQQMLAIGRALMTNPRLLILDEATEGLAPLVRAEIWNCLAALKREGLTLIVIDKNIGPLTRLADRHYIVEKGRIAWHGDSAALMASSQVLHQYVGV